MIRSAIGKSSNLQNGLKTMSTSVTSEEQKINYYRNLNERNLQENKPEDWDFAKPFHEIPGPKPAPIIGNLWRFLLPNGDYYKTDILTLQKKLFQQYGDIVILGGLKVRNPVIHLYNSEAIEKMYRNEGAWPIRHGLPSFDYYRTVTRKDKLKHGGLIAMQGEEWFKFRSIVNKFLMQPRSILLYIDKMNIVSDEFVENMRFFASQNDKGEMPETFNEELYKWALESVALVSTDQHLGCLNLNNPKNSVQEKMINSVIRMFVLMEELDIKPSFWKLVSTPNWREFVGILDFLIDQNLKYINESLEKLKSEQCPHLEGDMSVLEKLLKVDKDIAVSMCVDLLIAGIDTTGRILGATVYYLARHPEKQEELRKEINRLLPKKNTPVTKKTLDDMPYLRAVVKETMRLSTIAVGNLRTTVKDLVLNGYQIPKGTEVITCNLTACHMERNFPRPEEFLPERWMKGVTGELSYKNANPFVFSPFGHGPRACIGKRLANLEIEIALLKIIRNFKLEWPHEDMVFTTNTLHGLGKPLKVQLKEVPT